MRKNIKSFFLLTLSAFLLASSALGTEKKEIKKVRYLYAGKPMLGGSGQPEKYYQKLWCDEYKGKTEVILDNHTRADCVTETHVVEIDFSRKWAESIGRALHYARITEKRGGIVLVANRFNMRNVYKVRSIIDTYNLPIDLYLIKIK